MLARNSDVDEAARSVREMEDRFNHKYGYPWVFLNEQPFSDDFKRCAPPSSVFPLVLIVVFMHACKNSRVSNVVSGPVHFGQIPEEHWYQPSWINETRATEERDKMEEEGVIYGGSLSCDFPLFLLRICCDDGCGIQVSQHVPVQLRGSFLPSSRCQ
jgi:alpha 1,2-mannosyltransferase